MRHCVGLRVKLVVIQAFVDTHTPQYYRRMVAVLNNHIVHVVLCLLLPLAIPNVLPTGDFGKHQQTKLVALVHKVLTLWVVAGTHGI